MVQAKQGSATQTNVAASTKQKLGLGSQHGQALHIGGAGLELQN